MNVSGPPSGTRMTFDEFMAIPEDGVHRELIRGVVKVYPSDDEELPPNPWKTPTTTRTRSASRLLVTLACELENWLRTRPRPRGVIVGGDCGFRLGGPDDDIVGIDLAYVSAEQVAATDRELSAFDGPPRLAIEILAPSDMMGHIEEMVETYHEFGVAVWIADSYSRLITVHRPGRPTLGFNEEQELVGDPELPGFRLLVGKLFDD